MSIIDNSWGNSLFTLVENFSGDTH